MSTLQKETSKSENKNKPKPLLKKESKQKLKSTSSTRLEDPSRSIGLKSELKEFVRKDILMLAREFFEQNIWNRHCSPLKNNCLPVRSINDPPRAHGYMNNFLHTVIRPKGRRTKIKFPAPITDQIRVHAFRKNFFNIVAALNKEKILKKKAKQIVPPPYPRVHGFTSPVLAKFKCGRLKEKEEQLAKEKFSKKSKKTLDSETSQSQLKTSKSSDSSKHSLKTSDSTASKKSASEKKKKEKKKKKGDDGEDDKDDKDQEGIEINMEAVSKMSLTNIKSALEIMQTQNKCPYVLQSADGKKCLNRCCCRFIKSLPPTPRETFRQNPGNPHFYPGPGFKRRWGYELQIRRLARLEEERQRLCAEQRGIPYTGPPRQYQDFFDDTPVEERCCCDTCNKNNNGEADPNSFECNASDPHYYPRVAGFRHYFDNRENIKEEDKRLEELRKECEEIFPDIEKPSKKKSKSCLCRGAIVSGEKDKEAQIKEIVERMAAICTCLDECDCNAALQAREPYVNLGDSREVCCCARPLPSGQVRDTFDCNAGDPHQYPTVAAFKHAFEFKQKKKDRIAKRKSIYDEIVQHGTEAEIEEARVSLFKQIIEDGTEEEKEEARKSLEEARLSVQSDEINDTCDCPEIQEIVIMIEDSECDEEQIYNNCLPQGIPGFEPVPDAGNGMWLQSEIPEYQQEPGYWGPPEAFEPMESVETKTQAENLTLNTQTPPQFSKSEGSMHTKPKRTSETQTPRTSETQTQNSLRTSSNSKTSMISKREGSSLPNTKDGKEKLETSEKISQISRTTGSETRQSAENPETFEGSSQSSNKGLKNFLKKSGIKKSKKNREEPVQNLETAIPTDQDNTNKDSLGEELGVSTTATGRKKRKCNDSQKVPTKIRKKPKTTQDICKSLQQRQYVPKIKPTRLCCFEKKIKIHKEKENATHIQKPKRPCLSEKSRHKKSECICICAAKKKPKCIDLPETPQNETECICVSEVMKKPKCIYVPEKNHKYRAVPKQSKCICIPKSLQKPKCNSMQQKRRSRRLSEHMGNNLDMCFSETDVTNAENWPEENECQNFYEPVNVVYSPPICEPANREIFNFPPPKCSTIYQEFPQYDICSQNEMVFSIQVEQDEPSCEYLPANTKKVCFQQCMSKSSEESESSIYLTCSEDEEDAKPICKPSCRKNKAKESCFKCKQNNDSQIKPCKYREQSSKIPCRCREKSPCRCRELNSCRCRELNSCRCKDQLVRFSCECPKAPLETKKEEIQNEPVTIPPPKQPVKKEMKKGKWVFWRRVICKDGKEKFLKTSKCPVPKSIIRLDRNANKIVIEDDKPEDSPENTKNKMKKDTEKSENEKLASNSQSNKSDNNKGDEKNKGKKEKSGSKSKGNKKDKDEKRDKSSTEKNKRKKSEKEDENKNRNHNARARRSDSNKPFKLVPCKCANSEIEKINERMSCQCRQLCTEPVQKNMVCKNSKSGNYQNSVEAPGEYMLVVETVDPQPCNQIIEIREADCNPTIELFPIDPCAPLPPCACKGSKPLQDNSYYARSSTEGDPNTFRTSLENSARSTYEKSY